MSAHTPSNSGLRVALTRPVSRGAVEASRLAQGIRLRFILSVGQKLGGSKETSATRYYGHMQAGPRALAAHPALAPNGHLQPRAQTA
jgi:hypothetical protein